MMDTLFKFEYPVAFLSALSDENANFLRNFVVDFIPSLRIPNVADKADQLEPFLGHPSHTESSKFHLWTCIVYIRLSEVCKNNTSGRFYLPDSIKSFFSTDIPENNDEATIQYLYRCSFVCAYIRNLETPYGIFRLHIDDFLAVIQPWFVRNAKKLDVFHRTNIPLRKVPGIKRKDEEQNEPWDDGLPLCWWGMFGILWTLGILLHEEDSMAESFEPLTRAISEAVSEGIDYYGWQLFFYAGSGLDVWQQRTGIILPVIPKLNGRAVRVSVLPEESTKRNWKNPRD
jgi:hypothetical protein